MTDMTPGPVDGPDEGDYGGPTARWPVSAAAEDTAQDARSSMRDPAHLAELGRRMAELELEVTRLRSATLEATATEAVNSRAEPFTPPYIAQAVIAVENHLADVDRFAAIGNEIAAQESKIAAASRCCTVLRRLCDDDDFLQVLVEMGQLATGKEVPDFTPGLGVDTDMINTIVSRGFEERPFRDVEVQLLQLAGLTEALAQAHVDAAIRAYFRNPTSALERLQNPMTFLSHLRTLRDASCLTADVISQSLRQQRGRQRLKKLLTFGLSGTLIVAANSIGTALLGPIGVAASGAIGSAAVGVAVQLVA